MNTMTAPTKTMLLLALTALAGIAAQGEYVMHARISYDAGGTMVKGTDDAEWSHATINTLVLPGDVLWVDDGGTTELELMGGTYLRMADTSKAQLVSLPPDMLVQGWLGSFYVQRLNRSSGNVLFATPACRVEVEKDTSVRFDIVGDGATTITVRWGRVTLRTDAGPAVFVTAGERAWVDPGLLPSTPAPFNRNEEDAFDGWNRQRAKLLATGPETAVPQTVVISEPTLGVSELSNYGEWVYVEDRPCWRPTVVVDYIPYRYGHWTYVSGAGNVWVGNYPFCYVTSHYGRWNYSVSYGWLWSYDPVWSPAWVASVRCGDYFVWTPIDYYCRPVLAHESVYFSVGGLHFGIHTSSYVLADNLFWGPTYVYACQPDFVPYFNHHHGDINIWNINIYDRDRIPVPYDHSVSRVRNYNPQRSIRGPATFGAAGPTAVDRVNRLESAGGRSSFATVLRTGERGVRTSAAPDARAARVRSVRMSEMTPSTGTSRSGGATTAAIRSDSSGRTRATSDPREISRMTRTSGAEQSVRGATSRGEQASSPARVTRTEPSPAVRSRSSEAPVPRTPERSSVTTTRTSTPVSRDNTPPRTSVEGRTPRTVTRVPDSTRDTALRAPSPVSRPASEMRQYTSTPSRTIGESSSRTITTSPRNVTTRPALSRESVSAPSMTRSAPSVERSAPSVTRSAPSPSVSRSMPSVTQSAPSVTRSAPAPSVTRSAPSVTRSAPSVTRSAPSPSVSRSSSSGSSVTRSTPSRGSVRGR